MKILIADDEPNIVTALQFLLHQEGYAVEVARNGEEALAMVASGAPDLVLLDVMMPLKSGYEVQVATTGREALDLVAAGKPDLVLLDVMMPVVNGYDVCRAIRAGEQGKSIKIVMLTAKGGQGEQAAAAGADLYFPKPFSTSELVGVIGSLLAR